jgi:hypothetical protein
MDAPRSSKTLVSYHITTWNHNPEHHGLNNDDDEKLCKKNNNHKDYLHINYGFSE